VTTSQSRCDWSSDSRRVETPLQLFNAPILSHLLMVNNVLDAPEAPEALEALKALEPLEELDAFDAFDALAMMPSQSTPTSNPTSSSSLSRPGSASEQRASVSTISSAGTHLLTPRVESTQLSELSFQRTSLDAWVCEDAQEEKLSKWFGNVSTGELSD
jgi:hypothetical protein